MIGTAGASLGKWARKVYANDTAPALDVVQDGSGISIRFKGHIEPAEDNQYDIGTAAKSIRNLHVQTAIVATSVTGNWGPSADDSYDLGIVGKEWKDLRVDGKAYIDELGEDMVITDTFALLTGVNADDFFAAKAYDAGVGYVEVQRWVGAADPYTRIGRDDTGVAINAVTDMLVLQAGAGTNNEAAGFGAGISVLLGNAASQVEERASIDFVLVTATDGSEDSRIDFSVMVGGSMAKSLSIKDAGIAIVEKAAASPDVAGEGELWVKDDTPNVPYFTDDAGRDYPLIGHVYPLKNTYIDGTGTAGTDGTAQTVKTVVVPANTLRQIGDRLRIRVYFRGDSGSPVTMTATLNTVQIASQPDGGGTTWFMTETWLHYLGANNANIAETGAGAELASSSANAAGFDWTAAQDVDVDQDNVASNHIVVYAIFLDVYPKGVI